MSGGNSLIRKMVARKTSAKRAGSRFRWVRIVFLLALAVVLLPVFQVGCVRFVNPPVTPEMIRFRWAGGDEARERGLRYAWIPLADIPKDQIRYIWASEDQRFFKHSGIDWDEIELALEEAEESGEKPRGASTISMQCARSLFLWQGRSWIRKGLEAYYTILLEALLPKTRILELYLNVIEFGDGVYGINAAAETLYDVPPAKLTRSQMAMLAAILPNPKEWHPRRPTPRLLQRQQRVIRLARQANFPDAELER